MGDEYALGWLGQERSWAGGPVLTHSGSNTYWYAVQWLAPELDAAYLAVTNMAGASTPTALDRVISELIEGGPTLPNP